MSQKRFSNENFESYRKRLKQLAQDFKQRIRNGIRIVEIPISSGHGLKQFSPLNMKTKIAYSKMHKGESFINFQARRKASNAKRRQRENVAA